MQINEIQLYNILRNKLGEKEAETLVEFVQGRIEKEFANKKDVFLTKEDKIDIIRWMAMLIVGQTALLFTLVKLIWALP